MITNTKLGTKKGSMKKKLGMKGSVKPGDMITAMNKMKGGALSGVGRMAKAKLAPKARSKYTKAD